MYSNIFFVKVKAKNQKFTGDRLQVQGILDFDLHCVAVAFFLLFDDLKMQDGPTCQIQYKYTYRNYRPRTQYTCSVQS